MFDIPILFIIFNRPETEKKVFEVIRKIRPKILYVAADGPRKNNQFDIEKCVTAKEIIDNSINWPCEVHRLYREKNLGCKMAVSSAIDWFFENEEMGIILEDDCFPEISFFEFCKEMLIRYKDEKRVMIISGDNFQSGRKHGDGSYYFSRYPHVWGWATWKRVWDKYDVNMRSWSTVRGKSSVKFGGFFENIYWRNIFDSVYSRVVDTWDYQLVYLCLLNNGLNIVPSVNLVQNIGFGFEATHTKDKMFGGVMRIEKLRTPYKDPVDLANNVKADDFIRKNQFHLNWTHKLRLLVGI